MKRGLLLVTLIAISTACAPYEVRERERPDVAIPDDYLRAEGEGGRRVEEWWTELGSTELDDAVEDALASGFDIRQAWSRLEQARAGVGLEGAARWPTFDVGLNTNYTYTSNSAGFGGAFGGTFINNQSTWGISGTLNYEIDIWERIASRERGAALDAVAARFDVEATALVLSGSVVDAWLELGAQRSLANVLRGQVETSRSLLDLIEVRFGQGLGSSIDVLQQQQQLEAVEAELPAIEAGIATAQHRLDVLRGRTPRGADDIVVQALPQLPPRPHLGSPDELFERRPDLRAARARLEAADHRLASAVADRLPRITLSASADTGGQRGAGPFIREAGNLLGNIVAPLFDGGRRKAEVDRNAGVVRELAESFALTWLEAMREIEDSLALEASRVELLRRVDSQIALAQRTLTEAQTRYVNGQNDYLTVISAVQTLQALERQRVLEHRALLGARATLYRALGGAWTESLEPADAEDRTSPGLWERAS